MFLLFCSFNFYSTFFQERSLKFVSGVEKDLTLRKLYEIMNDFIQVGLARKSNKILIRNIPRIIEILQQDRAWFILSLKNRSPLTEKHFPPEVRFVSAESKHFFLDFLCWIVNRGKWINFPSRRIKRMKNVAVWCSIFYCFRHFIKNHS